MSDEAVTRITRPSADRVEVRGRDLTGDLIADIRLVCTLEFLAVIDEDAQTQEAVAT